MIQLHSLSLVPRGKPAIKVQEVQNSVLLKDKLWILQLAPVNAGEPHRFIVYVDTADKARTKAADHQLMESALEYLNSFNDFKANLERYIKSAL